MELEYTGIIVLAYFDNDSCFMYHLFHQAKERYFMYMIRKKMFEIIEHPDDSILGKAYNFFMMTAIVISILPLCFKGTNAFFEIIDKTTAFIFIIDYIIIFIISDIGKCKKRVFCFALYPFKPMALVDLLSILPSIIHVNKAFKVFKALRLMKAMRVFKVFRYSKNIQIIKSVLIKKKDALLTVGLLAVAYIFISALIIMQVEPDTFDNFYEATYWATVSLTTVGYGDIYPMSDIGKFVSMISSFFGIAIIALPSGIIMSGYQEVIETHNE